MGLTFAKYRQAVLEADFDKKLDYMWEQNDGMEDNLWDAVRTSLPTETIGEIVNDYIIGTEQNWDEQGVEFYLQLLTSLGVSNLDLLVMQGEEVKL